MSGIKYYVIDTETTGLKHNYHEITEISIIRCDDRVQLYKNIICDHPERASVDALAMTNKTIKDLYIGQPKEVVVQECNKFFSEDGLTPAHRCIVAHNAPFDRKFLHALWEFLGQEFPANLWLDTISLTQKFINNSDAGTLNITKTATGRISKTLHSACDIVGVKKLSGAHNAKVDSRNTYLLWKKLIEDHKIDYLSDIKTVIHTINKDDDAGLDIDLNDFI